MTESFYSAAAARRSLVYFVAGKTVAAITGLAVLLLMLRLVPVDVFGTYVALMAMTEIFYLATNFGLSYFAQRYVPELRMRAPPSQFARQLRTLLAMRAAFGLGFALLVWWASPAWSGALGLTLSKASATLFAASLVFGSIMRYIDELLQALLLQGWAQTQAVVRNLVRMLALSMVLLQWLPIDLQLLLTIETAVGILAVGAGLATLRSYSIRSRAAQTQVVPHGLPSDAWRQSLRFYWAQIIAQGYGANAIKLVVTAVLGVNGTAVLGFAMSISDLLRNYSPAFLLGGWVRPLMVARFVKNPVTTSVEPLARLVINLGLVGLLPFAIVFAVYGAEVSALLAAGKYPAAAPLLAPLVVVVCLQAVHAVLGMVCTTIERTSFVLLATTICLTILPLTYWATQTFGLAGTVGGLMLAELSWIAIVTVQLRRHYVKASFADVRGMARATFVAIVLAVALAFGHRAIAAPSTAAWIAVSVAVSLAYWLLAWRFGVLASDQRELIGALLRARGAGKR